jgi:hypothetical protein
VLRYSPLYRVKAPEGGWGVICLPRAYTAQPGTQLYKIVGITADSLYICLEEVQSVEAGYPSVYYTQESMVDFYETGEAVKTAKTDESNLRGNFTSTLTARLQSYVIVNGMWKRVTSEFRPRMELYSGILMKTDGLTVHESWSGKKMPINGAVEYIPGDVNNDGVTAVDDVVVAINYVLGTTPDKFVFAAADMNSDGQILVDDIVNIINTILGVSINE